MLIMKNKEEIIKAIQDVISAIDNNGFSISVYTEKGKECGLELEDWTPGGVDMIHFLDFRPNRGESKNILNIFDIFNEIKSHCDNFDVDDEIDAHREDKSYKDAFSYKQSVADFEEWERRLEKLRDDVESVIHKYSDEYIGEDFENLNVLMAHIVKPEH